MSRTRVAPLQVLALLVVLLAGLVGLAPPASADGPRVPVGRLTLSAKGAAFIGAWEGFRATPYNDPVGHCHIGYGHLLHLGPCTAANRANWGSISRARAANLLRKDAAVAVSGLHDQLGGLRLSQSEFDAMVSFTYNVGVTGFSRSAVGHDLTARPARYGQVPRHLKKYVFADGQFLCGLYRRRLSEGKLFSNGSYAIRTPPCPQGTSGEAPPSGTVVVSVAPGTEL